MPESVDAASQSDGVRILVVDDEPAIRFILAEALRDLCVSVVEAASADEAWQYLVAGGRVDLVFTDHRMPGSMTGAQLALRIRQRYPQLGVIVTSASFDDAEWRGPVQPKPYPLLQTAAELAARARSGRDEF